MKYILVIWLTITSFLVLADEDIVVGKQVTLHSDILNQDRVISIYTPSSYTRRLEKSYAVLYVLDGYGNFFHTLGSHFFLAGYRQMPELIIVGIHHRNRNHDLTPTPTDQARGSGGASSFRRFIKEELFDYIDTNYRTQQARFLSGHSYGGLFAIDTLLSEPSMFNAYFTFSPSLLYDNDIVLKELLKQATAKELSGYLYMNVGSEGLKMTRPLLEAHEALKANRQEKLTWRVDWLEEENHSTTPIIGQFNAYRDYFSAFQLSDSDMRRSADYVKNYYKDLSGRVGFSVQVPETIISTVAREYLMAKRYQDALSYYKVYSEHHPKSARAYEGLADVYLALSEEEKALEALHQAISLAELYQQSLLENLNEKLNKLFTSS